MTRADSLAQSAGSMRSGHHLLRTGRHHPAAHLAELDAVRGPAAENDLVTVLEESLAAEELDHRALRPRLRARDGARGHQVAGAQRRAVRRRVSELLRKRPVQRPRISARDRLAVQLHLERDVEGPVASTGEVLE